MGIQPADLSTLSDDQIGTYTRAFIDGKADYVVVDGWTLQKKWQRDDLDLLVPLGYLVYDQATSERESDEQYTAMCYRPSPEFVEALRQKKGIVQ